MVKRFKALFTIFFILFSITAGWAAPVTWKTNAATSDWSTASNWVGDTVPAPGDDATIPSGAANMPVITGYDSAGNTLNLTINKLTLQANTSLTLVLKDGTVNFTCANGIIKENVSPGAVPGKILVKHVSGSDEKDLAELINPFTAAAAKIKLEETGTSGNKTRTVTVSGISGVDSLKVFDSPYPSDSLIFNLDSEMEINDTLTNEASLNSSELKLSKEITIRKTFTNNGTFNANGKSVTFGSNCEITGTGTTKFFDLIIPDGCGLIVKQSIEINGGLNNGGTFDAVTHNKNVTFTGVEPKPSQITKSRTTKFGNLIVKSDATLNIRSNTNISISGNLENNGTFTNEIYNTVTFTGNSEISGSSNSAFYNLTIDNGKTCTFNQDIQVANILTNNGTLTPGAADRAVIFTGTDCRIKGNNVTTFGNLTINSGKKLTLEKDIEIGKALTNAGIFDANGKTVTLKPPTSGTVTVTGKSGANTHGDTSFNKLELTGAGSQILEIHNNIKVEDLYISGFSDTSKLTVQGTGEIELTNTHTPNEGPPKKGYYLDVKSNINIKNGAKYYITQSALASPPPANWELPASIRIWKGSAVDQNWGNTANWNTGTLPAADSLVIIPELSGISPTYPKLTDDTAKAEVVEIKSGAFLDLANRVISSDSTGSVRPKLIVEGTLKLEGTGAQKDWFPTPPPSGAEPDNKIILKPGSTVEYYGTSTGNVWEGPYEKLKISGTRNNLTAQELTVNKDLIIARTPVTITTTNGQTYHGNVHAFEGSSYYELNLTGSNSGTIKTSNSVTTGNLTVNGKWEAGYDGHPATVTVNGNLTVSGTWTASGNITLTGNLSVHTLTQNGGTLTFNGNGLSSLPTANQTFSCTTTGTINKLVIGSNADVRLNSNITLTGDFENNGAFNAYTFNKNVTISPGGRSVSITGSSSTDTSKSTKFYNLEFLNGADKTLTINKEIFVGNDLKLTGADGQPLTVTGGTGNPAIKLNNHKTGGKFLKVNTNISITGTTGGSNPKPYTYTVEHSLPVGDEGNIQAGKPENWIFTNYNGTISWTGKNSDVWADHRNWTPYSIPGKDTVVTIPRKPSSAPPSHSYPKLTKAGEAKSVTIAEKASLDLAGFVIKNGSGADDFTPITNDGTLKMTGTTFPSLAPLGGQKEWLASTNVANKITHGNKSAIEYYGTSTAFVWKGPYKNLILNSRPDLNIQNEDLVVEKKLTITGSPAHINTGTGTQIYQGEIDAKKSAEPHWNIEFTASSVTMAKDSETLNINTEAIKVNADAWTSSANINAASITASGSWTTKKGNINLRGGLSAGSFIQDDGSLTLDGSGGILTYTSTSGTAKIKSLTISSSATVNLGSDIIITEKFENNGTFNAITVLSPLSSHTVTLEHTPAPTGNRTIQIIGNTDKDKTKFHTLKCNLSGTTSKNIRFQGNVSVYGNLTLRGASDTVSLDISGTKEIEKPVGTPNSEHSGTIYINGDKNPSVEADRCKWLKIATNLPIKSLDSNENLYKCTAYQSIYAGDFADILPLLIAGHPKNWVFGDVDRLAWTGEIDKDWNNPGNWRPRQSGSPNGNQYVIVRNNASGNLPELGSGTYRAKEVEVRGNVTLDLGESVICTGLTGSNTAKLTTAGTLKLKGTDAQKRWFEAANDANKIHLDMGADTTTVIYYGDSSMPATAAGIWGGQYPNLEINGGITKLSTTGDLTVNRNFTVKTETQLSAAGNIGVEGKTTIEAKASLQAGGTNAVNTKDIFINAPASVNFKSPLNAASFVLYGGRVSLTDNCTGITAEKDIILLGSAYKTDDTAAAGIDSPSGVTGLFSYNNSNRPLPSGVSLIPLDIPSPAPSGSFDDLSGKTLKTNRNFYANGIELKAETGLNPSWTLDIPDNDIATAAFAEAYFTTVKNCTVKTNGSTETKACVAAAEGCTDSGGNTRWDFDRPTLRAYTVRDDVICLEFSEAIENSNNEISTAVSHIKLNNGADAFSGTFTTEACSTSTDNQGDLSKFYLKSSVRWNTDATGTNAGNGQSTDMGRSESDPPQNRSVIPNLVIPKAHYDTDPLKYIYETLRDAHKNRIGHYPDANPFTAVQDNCPPVLIGVYTGQEMHKPHNGTGTGGQSEYDAHNFIEFRYSEPVVLYKDENEPDTAKYVPSNSVNKRATDELGNITANGSGLKIAGFADIASGKVDAASRDGGIPHSLYRNFPAAAAGISAAPTAQSHRVRLSIAGYVDGTVTVGGNTVHKWIGYIDEAQTPSGTVTAPMESKVVRSLPTFDPDGTGPLQAVCVPAVRGPYTVTVGTSGSDLYGSWDTSPPVFAKFSKARTDWMEPAINEKEIVGFHSVSNIIDKMEFHFFDNTPDSSFPTSLWWRSPSKNTNPGWYDGDILILNTPYDTRGGSRHASSVPTPANTTTGGIRACSLDGSLGSFLFKKTENHTGNPYSFETGLNTIKQKTESTGLFPSQPSTMPTDTLYLQLSVKDYSSHAFTVSENFSIAYDGAGFVTDLAGNRMKAVNFADAKTVSMVAPRIVLTITPAGTDKMYILFNTGINTDPETLKKIPLNLQITGTGVPAVNTAIPATVRTETAAGTGIIVRLNQKVQYDSLLTGMVNIQPNSGAMHIEQSLFGLPAATGHKHTLSDFAVNIVRPLYVYDNNPDGALGIQSLESGLAMRIFDGSGGNRNTVVADKDLILGAVQENGGTAAALKMHYDINPLPASISHVFNKATGLKSRVWLPERLDALSFTPNTSAAKKSLDLKSSGASSVFSNKDTAQSFKFEPDKTVQFLFALQKDDGSGNLEDVTIDHDGDPATDSVPLYALRLKDPEDPTSIDLWYFNTVALKSQRGGVTVLNNVINTAERENVVVQVKTEKTGSLSVIVMTADGDVVKILHSGRVQEGEHTYHWNGTNKNGDSVARGMYFIRVIGPNIDETRKVMAVKE